MGIGCKRCFKLANPSKNLGVSHTLMLCWLKKLPLGEFLFNQTEVLSLRNSYYFLIQLSWFIPQGYI